MEVEPSIISVPSIGFIGEHAESQNRRFFLGWSDWDNSQEIGGFRESGKGTFVLMENDSLLFEGKLERPNDGKVSDNGTFILNDWMFGEALHGTFYAFDRSGVPLINHLFNANLLNSAISNDGKYAVCQCANSETEDGGVLAFFDIEARKLLWKSQPVTGWADTYSFDVEKSCLYLEYKGKGRFRYGFDGEFIDKTRWEAERVKFLSAFELSRMAKKLFKDSREDLSTQKADEILHLLSGAIQKGLDEYPNEKAIVYRTTGEVMEAIGNIDDAIVQYEMALSLNPKVGIKKRLDNLKKEKTQ